MARSIRPFSTSNLLIFLTRQGQASHLLIPPIFRLEFGEPFSSGRWPAAAMRGTVTFLLRVEYVRSNATRLSYRLYTLTAGNSVHGTL
jgi:hypothetical protein